MSQKYITTDIKKTDKLFQITQEPIEQVLETTRKKYEETKMELEIAEKNAEIREMRWRINLLNWMFYSE